VLTRRSALGFFRSHFFLHSLFIIPHQHHLAYSLMEWKIFQDTREGKLWLFHVKSFFLFFLSLSDRRTFTPSQRSAFFCRPSAFLSCCAFLPYLLVWTVTSPPRCSAFSPSLRVFIAVPTRYSDSPLDPPFGLTT